MKPIPERDIVAFVNIAVRSYGAQHLASADGYPLEFQTLASAARWADDSDINDRVHFTVPGYRVVGFTDPVVVNVSKEDLA